MVSIEWRSNWSSSLDTKPSRVTAFKVGERKSRQFLSKLVWGAACLTQSHHESLHSKWEREKTGNC